jgi:hypothetical protein
MSTYLNSQVKAKKKEYKTINLSKDHYRSHSFLKSSYMCGAELLLFSSFNYRVMQFNISSNIEIRNSRNASYNYFNSVLELRRNVLNTLFVWFSAHHSPSHVTFAEFLISCSSISSF